MHIAIFVAKEDRVIEEVLVVEQREALYSILVSELLGLVDQGHEAIVLVSLLLRLPPFFQDANLIYVLSDLVTLQAPDKLPVQYRCILS